MTDNVVQIGDLLIRRKRERIFSFEEGCRHKNMTWDKNGDFVTCDDCKMQLANAWVLARFMEQYEEAMAQVEAREKRLAEERGQELHRLASKKVDAVWRTRNMVPCCPHCSKGILPEDNLGASQMGRKVELGRRRNDTTRKPGLPIPPA